MPVDVSENLPFNCTVGVLLPKGRILALMRSGRAKSLMYEP